jgi:hypothetical protein
VLSFEKRVAFSLFFVRQLSMNECAKKPTEDEQHAKPEAKIHHGARA